MSTHQPGQIGDHPPRPIAAWIAVGALAGPALGTAIGALNGDVGRGALAGTFLGLLLGSVAALVSQQAAAARTA